MAKRAPKKSTKRSSPKLEEREQRYDRLAAKIRKGIDPTKAIAASIRPLAAAAAVATVQSLEVKPLRSDLAPLTRLPANPFHSLEDDLRQLLDACGVVYVLAKAVRDARVGDDLTAEVNRLRSLADFIPRAADAAWAKWRSLPARPVTGLVLRIGRRDPVGSYSELIIEIANATEFTFEFLQNRDDLRLWRAWAETFYPPAIPKIPEDLTLNMQRELRLISNREELDGDDASGDATVDNARESDSRYTPWITSRELIELMAANGDDNDSRQTILRRKKEWGAQIKPNTGGRKFRFLKESLRQHSVKYPPKWDQPTA